MTTDVVVEQVPADEPSIRAWYAVLTAAEVDRPLFFWPPVEAALVVWAHVRADREERLFLARRDGQVVGAGRLDLTHTENQHLANVKVFVPPVHRRSSVGTAILAELERAGRAAGRTTFLGEAAAPPGATASGALAFAEAHGYDRAGLMQLKTVDLAATADRLPALEADAAAHLGPYRLVWWRDRVPDEHLDSICHLYTRFLAEIPLEDVDLEPQTWEPQRIRDTEERRGRTGVTSMTAAAVAPDGTLAGYTDLTVTAGMRFSAIGGTLVLPEHRGHRLGLAMKVLLHQRHVELFPDVTHVVTGNAGVNAPMNAVNDLLGYVVVEDEHEVQKRPS